MSILLITKPTNLRLHQFVSPLLQSLNQRPDPHRENSIVCLYSLVLSLTEKTPPIKGVLTLSVGLVHLLNIHPFTLIVTHLVFI